MKTNWMIPRRIRNSGITTSENSTRLWPRSEEAGRRRDRRTGRTWTRTGQRDLDDSSGMDPSSLGRTGSHGYESLVIPDVPLPYAVSVVTAVERDVAKGRRRPVPSLRWNGRSTPLPGSWYHSIPMPDFRLVAPFEPTGDQPQAIDRLVDGLQKGLRQQTLLGATGTGKTFSIASVIEAHKKPTLVLAHNKTLAAQLYAEFREFFPDNAVEYFVSYFDYYQPEAYLPRSDTYIEKDSSRNDEIDRLRHAATHALFERRDVIIVASVSCIYGLGAPVDYGAPVLRLRQGGRARRGAVLRHLVAIQY